MVVRTLCIMLHLEQVSAQTKREERLSESIGCASPEVVVVGLHVVQLKVKTRSAVSLLVIKSTELGDIIQLELGHPLKCVDLLAQTLLQLFLLVGVVEQEHRGSGDSAKHWKYMLRHFRCD